MLVLNADNIRDYHKKSFKLNTLSANITDDILLRAEKTKIQALSIDFI